MDTRNKHSSGTGVRRAVQAKRMRRLKGQPMARTVARVRTTLTKIRPFSNSRSLVSPFPPSRVRPHIKNIAVLPRFRQANRNRAVPIVRPCRDTKPVKAGWAEGGLLTADATCE